MKRVIDSQQSEFEKNYSNRRLLADIWIAVQGNRIRFGTALFFRLLRDILAMAPAIIFATVVTYVSNYKSGEPLSFFWWLACAAVIVAVLMRFFQVIANRIGYTTINRVALSVQREGVKRLFHLGMAWHERVGTGVKLKYIDKGSSGVNRILREIQNNIIGTGVALIGMIGVLSSVDWRIALATALTMMVYLYLFRRLTVDFAACEREVNKKEGILSGAIFEAVNNVRAVKVLNLSKRVMGLVRDSSDRLYEANYRQIVVFQKRHILWLFIQLIGILGMIFIAYEVMQGRYQLGFLVLFNAYFSQLASATESLSHTAEELVLARQGVARMQEVFHEADVELAQEGKVNFPLKWRSLALNNVSFSYGGGEVLRNVSFEVKKGEKIGIVGLSGAGKSTLFKLLMKEYGGYQGDITVDGVSFGDLKKSSYYDAAAVVLQDTEVFNLSLKENIAIAGKGKLDEARLKRAMDVAHVSEFAKKLPEGIETIIGEKGVKLSGGERQRLGIARAVYKQPEILFLDEATSHLDLESEGKIRDSLHRFFKDVTAVVIAHRLTTIKEMDRIIVLEGGRIIEQGVFAGLMKEKGRFYQLWEQQKL